MKNAKRIAGILLALAMICVMVLPTFAAELTGLTGSITIKDNDTVKASEKSFSAYKILNLKVFGTTDENGKTTIDSYYYTVPNNEKLISFYETYFGLDRNDTDFDVKVVGKINDLTDEGELYDFAKAALAACKGMAVFPSERDAENKCSFIEGLELGYYIIADTTDTDNPNRKPVSGLILDTATPDVVIEVKAEKPSIDKKIDKDDNLETTDDRAEANEAAIGDTITYVIDSKVPDMTGYDKYYFIMRDTMSKGLTYTNNMKVTVGDKVLAEGVDYTLTETKNADGTTSLKIVFNNFVQYNVREYMDAPIQVSYTAVLNEDCEVNTIPNTNDVYLEYSNDPDVDCEGENEPTEEDLEKKPIGETPKEEVRTYTTTLEIVKTDPTGNRLQGAEFTLTGTTMNKVRVEKESFNLDPNGNYWMLKDGSFTMTDPESLIDNAPVDKSTYASLTDKYTKTTSVEIVEQEGESITITGTVGDDGILRFEGIPSGEYTITETKAPEGYNMLNDTIKVTISSEDQVVDGKAVVVFTYSEPAVDSNGVARVAVVNQIGSELPSTGGRGTTMFYILGGVLVLAAVVLLVARKRMSAHA